MSIWKFELANSSNFARIGELTQARERSLNLTLNKGGSFSFKLPLVDDIGSLISEVSTCVIISRLYDSGNIIPVWSGPVWTINESTPNDLNIDCVGWLQTLEKRISKPAWGNPLIYSDKDSGDIAFDLLNKSNLDSAYSSTNYISPGINAGSQLRDITYQPYINILNEIENLSNIEDGYDMLIDPLTKKLNIYSQLETVRNNINFEYRSAAQNVTRSSDSSKICNSIYVYSSTGVAQQTDVDSQAQYGLFEEAVSLSDATDISILQAYANGEIAVRSRPLRLSSFIPRPFSSQNPNDPRIFDDFNVGDIVYFSINKGRLQIPKQAARVFSASVNFNDTGTESITTISTQASS